MFGNEAVDHFYVDKKGLEDLMEFYEIEFEVIRGYGFKSGFNGKIKRFIKTLFDLRAKYKAEENPLQQTVKLLMNSIYGKSIMKEILNEDEDFTEM
jgi:DNA polymerase elongation subunit (family B)